MSYLTRIQLARQQAIRLEIFDSYVWHQKLWEAFPDRDQNDRDFLFRVDDTQDAFTVLMLSAYAPEPPTWGYWEVKSIADSFLGHERYMFDLRANPTVRKKDSRKRVGLCTEPDLRAWMERKAESAGMAVDLSTLAVAPPIMQTFHKPGNSKPGHHLSVDFRGSLTVTDRDAFTAAFTQGIGSAKAFGFGLLMLQPII